MTHNEYKCHAVVSTVLSIEVCATPYFDEQGVENGSEEGPE